MEVSPEQVSWGVRDFGGGTGGDCCESSGRDESCGGRGDCEGF